MSQFDDLVAKYRNLSYGNLQGQNPSSVNSLLDDYNDRKFFTTHLDSMDNRFVRDEFGRLQFSTPEMGLLSDGTGYATYDPYFDYGDPGYAAAFQPNEDYLVDAQTVTRMQGGNSQENLDRFRAMQEQSRLRSELAKDLDKFNMLPGYEESKLPGFLGFIDETLSNIDRQIAIDKYMRDIDESTSFEQDIKDSAYKGADPDSDPSGGAAPTTGPSGDDDALGKGIPGLGPQNGGGGNNSGGGSGSVGTSGGPGGGNFGGTGHGLA